MLHCFSDGFWINNIAFDIEDVVGGGNWHELFDAYSRVFGFFIRFWFCTSVWPKYYLCFAGAQALKKEGVDIGGGSVNYRLLSTMISVAKSVYCILAVVVLLIMLTLGTAYIYKVTHGFKDVHNSLLIWIVYSISVFLKCITPIIVHC